MAEMIYFKHPTVENLVIGSRARLDTASESPLTDEEILIAALHDRVISLESTLTAVRGELEGLSQRYMDLQSESADKDNEVEQLRGELEEARKERDAAVRRHERVSILSANRGIYLSEYFDSVTEAGIDVEFQDGDEVTGAPEKLLEWVKATKSQLTTLRTAAERETKRLDAITNRNIIETIDFMGTTVPYWNVETPKGELFTTAGDDMTLRDCIDQAIQSAAPSATPSERNHDDPR